MVVVVSQLAVFPKAKGVDLPGRSSEDSVIGPTGQLNDPLTELGHFDLLESVALALKQLAILDNVLLAHHRMRLYRVLRPVLILINLLVNHIELIVDDLHLLQP